MTTRTNLIIALSGGKPETTPLSIYSWMINDWKSDQGQRLLEQGLGLCEHCKTVSRIEHGVEEVVEEREEGGDFYLIHTKKTPVGDIRQVHVNNWHTEYWIKEPRDYNVMRWIVEHTELVAQYDEYQKAEDAVGECGVAVVTGSRTPAMSINVDLAGTEQFCLDVALEVLELFELYKSLEKLFIDETVLIADGPGAFVKWFENLTISMLGAQRYSELLSPVYDLCVPILESAGKRVMVHYDGALRIIADQIARAPYHIVESLTEPPEGDMTYDECRALWPDKAFWANINLDCYYLPPDELKQQVISKRNRAGKRGLAFEISEELPSNWTRSIPVVLDALQAAK